MPKTTNEKKICEFCKRGFVREESFISHNCERRDRYNFKDTKEGRLAFDLFKKINTHIRVCSKYEVSYEDLIRNKFYNDILALADFILQNDVMVYEKYVDYLIQHSIKIGNWCKQSTYDKYLDVFLKSEDPLSGIERTIKTISSTGIKLEDFYDKINSNVLVNLIKSGKISPWLIYISSDAKDMLGNLDESQRKLIKNVINPVSWKLKKQKYSAECEYLKTLLKSYKL